MSEEVLSPPGDKVATSLFEFVLELLRLEGVPSSKHPPALVEAAREASQSPSLDWAIYISAIEFLGAKRGVEGIARSMRAARPHAYAEIRTMFHLFRDVATFFRFFNEQVMTELNPCVSMRVEPKAPGLFHITVRIADHLDGSRTFHEGTKVLVELFPSHADLPEAKVEVISMNARQSELLAQFPTTTTAALDHRSAVDRAATAGLTPREAEVLRYVCDGLTNAAIAEALGTARSTVKNQISAILAKVGAANRTELAARAARQS